MRLFLTGWLLVALAATAPPVAAQSVAHAAARNVKLANRLAQQAVDLLHKGEDSTRAAVKHAAYAEGERLARKAVDLDETNADAHWALFANKGRRMQTEGLGPNPLLLWGLKRQLDRCLELNPEHYDALVARGGLYRQLPRLLGGDMEKAEHYLSRAVALNPQAVGGRIELARTYLDLGQAQRAVRVLTVAARWAERLGQEGDLTEARLLLYKLDPNGAAAHVTAACAAPRPPLTLAFQVREYSPWQAQVARR